MPARKVPAAPEVLRSSSLTLRDGARRRRRREAVRRARHRGGRSGATKRGDGLPRRERVRRDVGDRAPRRARRAARRCAPSGRAGGATSCRSSRETWPLVVQERAKEQFEVVRQRARRPATSTRGRLRDGRRARGGADLPVHLRGGRLHEAGQAALDLVADARGDPRRPREAAARRRSSTASPTRRAAGAAPTGSSG